MMQGVARRLGYVPQQELAATVAKLKETRERLERASRSLEQAKSAAEKTKLATEELKRQVSAAEKAAVGAREDAKRLDAQLSKLAVAHERRVAEIKDELTVRSAKRVAALEEKAAAAARAAEARISEWQQMEERVAATVQDLDTAYDHLLAVEVKLDIVEGAANVLDRRLRAVRPPGVRPAPASAG